MDTLETEISRASQQDKPLSIALFEIDYIDEIINTYGHAAADYLFRRVKQHISSELGDFDSVNHSEKGDILLVFNCSKKNAKRIFERVRLSIANTPFYYEQHIIKVTISCGITVFSPPIDLRNSQCLIDAADQALYSARDSGKNAVVYIDG